MRTSRWGLLRDLRLLAGVMAGAAQDFRGLATRTCAVCGFVGRFRPFGRPHRVDALCPKCGSLERHRLLARYASGARLFRDRQVLHFAPEACLSRFIEDQQPRSYAVSDFGDATTLDLDIENMRLEDGSFDLVLASHVLEHVDDRKALSEIHRVLRPNGILVLMVPLVEGWRSTYENEAMTSHHDRRLHFGQFDHVRFYGSDVRSRLSAAGFDVEEYTAEEPDVTEYSLQRGEKVFLCTRRSDDGRVPAEG
jgi:SAM-dependent methyltransferase